jgi:selenide, water dikinase
VTGFGLLGHALEMARGSRSRLMISIADVPLLSQAAALAQQGYVTGASDRNWASYGAEVELPSDIAEWQRHILTDPQTSGGLLVSCEHRRAERILTVISRAGYANASIIGRVGGGGPGVVAIA